MFRQELLDDDVQRVLERSHHSTHPIACPSEHAHRRPTWPCDSHRGALVVRGDGHGECAAYVCRASIQGETTHNAHTGPGREEVTGVRHASGVHTI